MKATRKNRGLTPFLLKWLRRSRVCLFFRDDGPVCYEIPCSLVEEKELPRLLLILKNRLSCVVRLRPHYQNDTGVRWPVRVSKDYELLDSWSESEIIRAIRFRDRDYNGLCVEFIGSVSAEGLLDSVSRREQLRQFATASSGTISLVVIRLGDSPFWYTFLCQTSCGTAELCSDLLKVVGAAPIKRIPYHRLNLMTLEQFYRDDLSC